VESEERIVKYLLGELSSEEAERIERECFGNEKFAETVFVTEDELVDQYVRGELSVDERNRFEQFYLTTAARHDRLAVARTLKQQFGRVPVVLLSPRESIAGSEKTLSVFDTFRPRHLLTFPLVGYALAAIALVVVSFGLWRLLRYQDRKAQIAETMRQSGTPQPTPTTSTEIATPNPLTTPDATPASSMASPSPQTSPGNEHKPQDVEPKFALISFTLRPGALRDPLAGEHVLKLPTQTRTVLLRFVLNDNAKQIYTVEIQTADGHVALVRRRVEAAWSNNETVLSLRAPASIFSSGDYVGRALDASNQTAASYVFRIEKTN
jgi:hypothetical protein